MICTVMDGPYTSALGRGCLADKLLEILASASFGIQYYCIKQPVEYIITASTAIKGSDQ